MALERNKNIIARILRSLLRRLQNQSEKLRVKFHTRFIYGPDQIKLADNECAVVSMVKDAEYFIDEMIQEHQRIGIKHILLIDNGSRDRTIQRASKYANVTIVQNKLPPARYETRLRGEIPKRYILGGWILFVDSDEMINLPYDLTKILCYCNMMSYTAVVGQMLDMFSPFPLLETSSISYKNSLILFNRFSTEYIERVPFSSSKIPFSWHLSHNVNSNSHVMVFYGGIRRAQFGEGCCLTKQPLVRNLPEVVLSAHPHCARNVTYADFTILIKHYKFCGDVLAREKMQVNESVWNHGQDKARVRKIEKDDKFVIDCDSVKEFKDICQLQDEGFLVKSDRLEQFEKNCTSI